jgi:PAS domain S-box-containing protein
MPWAVLALDREGILTLVNPQAAYLLGRPAVELQGQALSQVLPPSFPIKLRQALQEATTTSTSVVGEFFLPDCQQWVEMSTDPGETEVLVYWQDITRVKTQQRRYLALADNIPDVITRWGPDLRLRYANASLEIKTGQPLAAMLGKTFPEMGVPASITNPYTEKLQRVFTTGQPLDHYNTFPTPHGERHYHSRIVPEIHNGEVRFVLSIAHDITELKQAEHELRRAHRRLNAIFEAVPLQLGYYQSVRDAQGKVVDLRSEAANGASLHMMSLPASAHGILMSEQLPGLQGHAVWQNITEVIETGQAQRLELFYDFGLAAIWFDVSYTPFEDGVISASLDITTRKQIEQALRDSQQLLQATLNAIPDSLEVLESVRDDSGRLIDFEWTLTNTAAHRLLSRTDVVGKRLLREEAAMQSSGVFDRFCEVVERQETTDFELRYPDDSVEEWFHVIATPFRNGLIVNWHNITARKQATAELLRLQLQQHQQLANAVLDAQEVERKRIAESLHNGLGQLLYAAKLHLDQLSAIAEAPLFADQMRKTEQMLSTAINQTRSLSHQLMPVVLTDFGLAAALQDICQDFSTPSLRLHCYATPLPALNQSLALAVYRMAQELANNIVKHADATEAYLRLTEHDGWLELLAEDNGRGFDSSQQRKDGMGLNALRDRVKLLNGQLTITSTPEQGTHIRVRVPSTALAAGPTAS